MSPRQASHLGLFLLGAYLIVQSLAGVADSFGVALVISTGEEPLEKAVTSVVVAAAVRTVAVVLFGVGPGALLMWKSRSWSEALFLAEESSPSTSPSILLAIGLLLLGSYLGVSGLALFIGGVAQAASSYDRAASYGIRELGRGGTYVVAGTVFLLWSRHLRRNAA